MAHEYLYSMPLYAVRASRFCKGVTLCAVTTNDAPVLYQVYLDAFSTRTTSPLDEPTWTRKWPVHAMCAHDFSIIARIDHEPVGYLLSYNDPAHPDGGFIGQMGVRVGMRMRGIGAAMILHALDLFTQRGLSTATLRAHPTTRTRSACMNHWGSHAQTWGIRHDRRGVTQTRRRTVC